MWPPLTRCVAYRDDLTRYVVWMAAGVSHIFNTP